MHTHYNSQHEKWYTPGTCDNCGSQVQEANTVSAKRSQLPKLRRLGVVIVTGSMPPELCYNDDTNRCECENCYGVETVEAK